MSAVRWSAKDLELVLQLPNSLFRTVHGLTKYVGVWATTLLLFARGDRLAHVATVRLARHRMCSGTKKAPMLRLGC